MKIGFSVTIAATLLTISATTATALTFTGGSIVVDDTNTAYEAVFQSEGFTWPILSQYGGTCGSNPTRVSLGGDGLYDHGYCELGQFSRVDGTMFDLTAITLDVFNGVQISSFPQPTVDALNAEDRTYAPWNGTSYSDAYVAAAESYISHANPLEDAARFSITGYRGANAVVTKAFTGSGPTTLSLAGFENIDGFSVTGDLSGVKTMWNHYYDDYGYAFLDEGTAFCRDPGCLTADVTAFDYVTPVPVPAGFWLLGMGLFGIGAAKRRR